MTGKESRDITINGNKYHIVVKETKRKQRVSVYEHDTFRSYVVGRNDLATREEQKGAILWFGMDDSSPIEELIQKTLNEAVCTREERQEKEDEYDNRIQSALDSVKEVHDES